MRILALVLWLAASCVAAADPGVQRLAFGSCNKTDRPQPLWQAIIDTQPDAWIWTGDIVYADDGDLADLRAKYAKLKTHPGYARLLARCPVLGIYDDHDYGLKDGGREYAHRAESQRALLDFLDEPADSRRRRRAGAYASADLGQGAQRIRVILLDTRYHREAPGDSADVLGEAQWSWLATQLHDSPARVHVIVSSIQVLSSEHRWEKWANFPQARARLLDLVRTSGAPGAVFLSGDRHLGEISRLDGTTGGELIYDVTASGLTHSWTSFPGEPNRLRVGSVYHQLNFGLLQIDWNTDPVVVDLQIRDQRGAVVRSQRMYVPQ